MHFSVRARLGTAALLLTALGLAGPTATPVHAAQAVATHPTVAKAAHMPTLRFTISKAGKLRLHGSHTVRPGRVAFKVTGKSPSGTVGFVRFSKGYSFAMFRKDVKALNHGKIKALRHALKHTTFLGGAAAPPGQTMTGTVVLPKRGDYIAYNFGAAAPKSPVTIHAVGSKSRAKAPRTTGTVLAMSGARFGGASSMPHQGNLLFKNRATDSPHLLVLQQVQPGTTAQQVQMAVMGTGPGDFILPAGLQTEVIGQHQSMTLRYSLPAGTYAEMCFFPDKKTGMPHAFMGMIRIITLS